MKKQNGKQSTDPILAELEEIKRLLMLGLLTQGQTQAEIASALGVTQGTVSKMFPKPVGRKGRRE
jgi:DNA-directed RNA polymerase specialized sigma subunit